MKCTICSKPIEGYQNNPAPFRGDACCDECNAKVIIPARIFLGRIKNKQAMILEEDNSLRFIQTEGRVLSLEQLQEAVKGYIEIFPKKIPGYLVIVNEEGLLKDMKLNRLAELAYGIKAVGPVLICPSHLME